MSKPPTAKKRPTHYTVNLPHELAARVEAHRSTLDGLRPEGAAVTTRGEAIRNLIIRGLATQ